MKVRLTVSFELTDERIGSAYARPLLVNLGTGKAHGPKDIIEPYWNWGLKPAAIQVVRMSKDNIYTDEEMEFIKRFCITGGSGPIPA